MNSDEKYMRRCFDLAQLGIGSVSPNPMVGSVIVYNDKIIGEGYHQKCGEAHAEVNAVNSIKDKNLLSESSIYVNLEPCSHYGRTPPCADLIVKHKFKRVIISCLDSNPEVSGRGINRLKENGIEVTTGVLEKEGRFLNRRFFTYQEKKRPYIILKWAESNDGFIDRERNDDEVKINWISHKNTKKISHKWRAEEDAILVGRQTVENDNPSLTTREVKGENPLRIVLDPQNKLGNKMDDLKVFNAEAKTLQFNRIKEHIRKNVESVVIEESSSYLKSVLMELYNRSIQSLIIEGGKSTLEGFIKEDLWDEARVIKGKPMFASGLEAPKLDTEASYSEQFFGDEISYFFNL